MNEFMTLTEVLIIALSFTAFVFSLIGLGLSIFSILRQNQYTLQPFSQPEENMNWDLDSISEQINQFSPQASQDHTDIFKTYKEQTKFEEPNNMDDMV